MMYLPQWAIVKQHFYWYKVLSVFFDNLISPSSLGLLASVGNLTNTLINESSVLLSWTAPYTLDNVPITGYSINDSGRILNTTDLSYILSPVCDMINVTLTVSAVNAAGVGQSASTSFYHERGIIFMFVFNQLQSIIVFVPY